MPKPAHTLFQGRNRGNGREEREKKKCKEEWE